MNESNKHISTPMGIHRVLKEPYDDREIFTSIDDLKDYCKNGASYNGQRVACIIGTKDKGGYIQDFVINNGIPVAKFNNSEIIIATNTNAMTQYSYTITSNYILLYSSFTTYTVTNLFTHDPSTKSHLNYFSNINNGYSIMELTKLFEYYNNGTKAPAKFMLVIKDNKYPYKNLYAMFTWKYLEDMYDLLHNTSQTYNTAATDLSSRTTYDTVSGVRIAHDNSDTSLMKIIVTTASGDTITLHLFPKSKSANTYSFWLYAYSPDYVEASGVI